VGRRSELLPLAAGWSQRVNHHLGAALRCVNKQTKLRRKSGGLRDDHNSGLAAILNADADDYSHLTGADGLQRRLTELLSDEVGRSFAEQESVAIN